jgi:phosphonate transport system ATP-binding protein
VPGSTNSQPHSGGAGTEILALRNVFCSRGGQPVLCGVDCVVHEREYVAVLGANGAGKSTLFRICAGLFAPDAGSVTVLGKRLESGRPGQRQELGFIFQKHQLVPRLSVLTNVVQGRLGFPEGWRCVSQVTAPRWVRLRAMACLDEVGLASKARQLVQTLSGGESQRVAIARVLIREPAFILADEPTASLDPTAGEEVLNLLQRVARRHRTAVLLATHDVRRALAHADRILGLRDGRFLIDKPARDLTLDQLDGLYQRNSARWEEGEPNDAPR